MSKKFYVLEGTKEAVFTYLRVQTENENIAQR